MTTRILRSFAALAAVVAIIALFGAGEAQAQQNCFSINVTNNTGVAVRIKMYDASGAIVVDSAISATGGSFPVPLLPVIVQGFISAKGTQIPSGIPCTACFRIPLANGAPGPCVVACGGPNCTLTLNLCNGTCIP